MMEDLLSEFPSFQQQAANEKTTGDRLQELARVDMESAKLVAQSQSAPPELLRELAASDDATIRFHVVGNANTPTQVLLQLGAEFPEQLLNNPVFPLLFLENPNLVNEMPLTTLCSLLQQQKVPIFFLEQAANNLDREVRLAVAMNPQTPRKVLEKLVQNQRTYNSLIELFDNRDISVVTEAVRLHVNWSSETTEGWDEAVKQAIQLSIFSREDRRYLQELAEINLIPELAIARQISGIPQLLAKTVLEELAQHEYWDIRATVAENPQTPNSILEQLAGDGNAIRYRVARHPNTSGKILEWLARDNNCGVRQEVAKNPYAPARVLEQLAKDRNMEVRYHLTQNPNLPESTLEKLALDDDFWTRREVAKNPRTPGKILAQLAHDEHFWIRWEVAKNPNIPKTVLKQFIEDRYFAIDRNIAEHDNSPLSILTQLLGDRAKFWLRREIARNPNTPANILEQLVQDDEFSIRLEIARNRHTPEKILEKLAQDCDCRLRWEVAKNPSTPASVLEQLVKDKDAKVIYSLTENPNTPAAILEQLAKPKEQNHLEDEFAALEQLLDGSLDIRENVAKHPNTSTSTLEQLLTDPVDIIRQLALAQYEARNPKSVSEMLEYHAKNSTPFFTRLFVLLHPQTPGLALAKNYRSTAWLERYAIAQHSNTPPTTLKALAGDANRFVRAAAQTNLQSRNQQR